MDWKQIGLIVAVLALVVLAQRLGKRHGQGTRSARLMKKYAVITRETFETIPEDELVEAVVSRVLARAAKDRRPDPVKTLAGMEHGSTVVYSVWAVCKEMAAADFAALMATATRELVEPAREAMTAMGAVRCAGALETMRAAFAAGEEYTEAEQTFRVAVTEETPLSLCEGYIRDHADEFIDQQEEQV